MHPIAEDDASEQGPLNQDPLGQHPWAPFGGRSAAMDHTITQALALWRRGRNPDADRLLRAVLLVAPERWDARNLMGVTALAQERWSEARGHLIRAAALAPLSADVHANLGATWLPEKQTDTANNCFAKAVALDPRVPAARRGLAMVFWGRKEHKKSLCILSQLIALQPTDVDPVLEMGNFLLRLNLLEMAEQVLQLAVLSTPDDSRGWNTLGVVRQSCGDPHGARQMFLRALQLQPTYAEAHSNLLFSLQNDDKISPAGLFDVYRAWERHHALPVYNRFRPHDNDPDPDRRLILGYLSADMRNHAVGHVLATILPNHDRRRVRIYAYSTTDRPDQKTLWFRDQVDRWRIIRGMEDELVADLIRSDEVDILIAVAGHTADNRMRICAFRPAPVQVSLADLSTSGLSVMDYWVTDSCLHPSDTSERFSETLMRLPATYPNQPPQGAPEPGPLPLLDRGHATFGSCCNPAKITAKTLDLWASALTAVPTARMVFKYVNAYAHPTICQRVAGGLQKRGIASDRLDFRYGLHSRGNHVAVYQDIDITLDTVPFNGWTTSIESLWMGVPVVTLAGKRAVARASTCFLHRLGLDEFAAGDEAAFPEIVANLVAAPNRLAALRQTLRSRMADSALCDGPGFTANFEAALRDAWRLWCRKGRHERFDPL